MKRRASDDTGSEFPAKVSKEAGISETSTLTRADTVVNKSVDGEPSRSRQRKAPAWLSSYVTGGSAKDIAKAVAETPSPPKKSPSISPKKKTSGEDGKKIEETTPKKPKEKSVIKTKPVQKVPVNNKLISSKSLSPTTSVQASTSSSTSFSKSSPKQISVLDSKPSDQFSSESGLANSENIVEVCEEGRVGSTQTVLSKGLNTASVSSFFGNKKESTSADVRSIANGSVKDEKITAMVKEDTMMLSKKGETPTMLEVVICISTSGAMQEYLAELQEQVREMVWRLQSLVPDLRIGVFAHTQGGIHDDKRGGGSCSAANIDHNYIRTGGHSGTKWLDLGASFSQICAFVNSLEPESVVYPDYVQDNLEMALWKLQRCMTWSSCSYRTVVMVGRGRPNSTTFYLQREHWRGWIRSALELGPRQEVPVIDWQLEARLLAQMGIHVFTLQVVSQKSSSEPEEEDEEEEGTKFFHETASITNGQHFRISDASRLVDIIVGVCCACYGPDLLQEHRDELRDLNDGVMPANLKDIFVSLGLHSNRRSLKTIPSLVGDLHAMQNKIKAADLANGRLLSTSEEEGGMSSEGEDWAAKTADLKVETNTNTKGNKKPGRKPKVEKGGVKPQAAGKATVKKEKGKTENKDGVKKGRVEKKSLKPAEKKKAAKALTLLKPNKANGDGRKPPASRDGKDNGVLKTETTKSVNDKQETEVKPVKKVGRPKLTSKAAALVKKAAANKTKINNLREKKVPERKVPSNKSKDKTQPTPTPNAPGTEVKAKRGRPPKSKPTPDPQPKTHAKKIIQKAPDKDVQEAKKTQIKSGEVASVSDRKKGVTKDKAETRGSSANSNKKLLNGKTQLKRNQAIKNNLVANKNTKIMKGTSKAVDKKLTLVKGKAAPGKNQVITSAKKRPGQAARKKGEVTITRGALRTRK